MDDMEIVSALLAQLVERVGRERYELWFGGQTRLSLRPTALVISTPNRFYQDWLRNHFRRDLEEVVQAVLGRALPLEFRIDSELQSLAPQHVVSARFRKLPKWLNLCSLRKRAMNPRRRFSLSVGRSRHPHTRQSPPTSRIQRSQQQRNQLARGDGWASIRL